MAYGEYLGGFEMTDTIQHSRTQTQMYKIMGYMMTGHEREITEVYRSAKQDWG